MQIDWITGAIEAPPTLSPGYDAGRHLRLGPSGELLKEWAAKSSIEDDSEGSFSRKFTIWTPSGAELFLSGNPVKLLQGHNAFGSCDAVGLFLQAGLFVRQFAGLFPSPRTWESCQFAGPRFTRLDLTRSYRFPSSRHALTWLRDVAATARDRRGSTLTKGETVYFGKHSTRWTMKLYEKSTELLKRMTEKGHGVPRSVLDWSAGVVRFELTLRSPELKKHPEKVAQLCGSRASLAALDLWQEYYDRVTFNRNLQMSQAELLEQSLPDHLRLKLGAWRGGTDMRSVMSKPTFYRVRRQLLDAVGVDIASKPVEPAPTAPDIDPGLDPAGWDPEPLAAHYVEPDQDVSRQYGFSL